MEKELGALQNVINTATAFVVEYGFQILGAVIILLIGAQIAKWVAHAVLSLCTRRKLDVTVSKFFSGIAKGLVLAFVIVIALGKFGITIAPFIAAIGALAFGASLAVQGPLSNFGAGIAIILGRPFVVGNTITVLNVSGVVEEVRLGATLLSTEDGEIITIPNKQILGEVLCNSFAHRIVEASIGISYTDDPEQAIAAVAQTLAAVPEVSQDPAPQIGIDCFADSSVQIGFRYWVPTKRYFHVRYAVNQAIYKALTQARISIAYPRLEVYAKGEQHS